jgi:hypothetical protein
VKIVALGDNTPDAQRFTQGKPIELIDESALLSPVKNEQTSREIKRSGDTPLPFIASVVASLAIINTLPLTSLSATFEVTLRPTQPMTNLPLCAAKVVRIAPNSTPPQVCREQNLPFTTMLRKTKLSYVHRNGKNAESMKLLEKRTPEVPLRLASND